MFCVKDFTEIMKRITLFTVGLSLLLLCGLAANAQFQLSETMAARQNLFAGRNIGKIAEISALVKTKSKRAAVRRKALKFSGRWKGTLSQPDGPLRAKFKFTMRLYQKGKKVSGFSRIALIDAPQYYGIMRLRGTIEKNRLMFTETRITRENPEPDSRWCIKTGKLRLAYVKGKLTLRGNWQGSDCSPGSIVLRMVSGN